MAKPIRCYFPLFETEAHRQNWRGAHLASCLLEEGIECQLTLDGTCDVAFLASYFTFYEAVHGGVLKPYERTYLGTEHFPALPTVFYCWDLYPFQVENQAGVDARDGEALRWRNYLTELAKATEIWVPSQCTTERVRQYVKRESKVVLSSCPQWEPLQEPWDGGYVVDVMRAYPGDPNAGICKRACDELGIPCYELGDHSRTWDEFRSLIAGARLLVSANYEASTGGLTLLEGYRLGKPVLLSNSPRHGGKDYFGERAGYFQWDSYESLKRAISEPLYQSDAYFCRRWVDSQYSDSCFAKRIAYGLKRVVNG